MYFHYLFIIPCPVGYTPVNDNANEACLLSIGPDGSL